MSYIKDLIKKILIALSVQVLKKHKPYIIAIIGSVGKTTTRNTLYTVLSKKHSVRKTEQSLTTDIGVPLTLLGCPYPITTPEGLVRNFFAAMRQVYVSKTYPEYVILEIDGHTRGEMKRLASWLSIDLLVVTAIGEIPSHVEHFEHPSVLREEYAYIRTALKPHSKVVVYADDEYAREVAGTDHPTVSYGSESRADVSASPYSIVYENAMPAGISFSLIKPVSQTPIVMKDVLGIHIVNGVLSSVAVLKALEEHHFSINTLVEKMPPLPGRMRLILGLHNSLIIDDSYNSSPVAIEELISVFNKIEGKRKILVLGDMLELGRFSTEAHREIGRQCVGFDMLVCVGMRARFIKEGALEAGLSADTVLHFDAPEKAGAHIQNILKAGDIVAVKGSQSMRMERCVEEIMAEPEKKEKLLVRQSEEWLERW
jgi:UDP-N-acetylmuramoyl-tripeptide--D-alanyl-D-alanine ligase